MTVRALEEASCDVPEIFTDQCNQLCLWEDEVDKLSPSTEEELQHEVEDHVSELTHMEAHEYKESEISQVNTLRDGQKRLLPTIFACQKAFSDLTEIINPHRKNA